MICYIILGLQQMHFASKTPSMNAKILADFSCQVVAEQCIFFTKNQSMPKSGFRILYLNVNKVFNILFFCDFVEFIFKGILIDL